MQRIDTRTELINFICENISQYTIVRACHRSEKSVQVLGGFKIVPPSTSPGWIVSVTSIYGQTWLIAVTSDDHRHIFRTWIIEKIPWEYYIGKSDQGKYSIYSGDNPQQAERARNDKIKTVL